jgi:hypothetical protein
MSEGWFLLDKMLKIIHEMLYNGAIMTFYAEYTGRYLKL